MELSLNTLSQMKFIRLESFWYLKYRRETMRNYYYWFTALPWWVELQTEVFVYPDAITTESFTASKGMSVNEAIGMRSLVNGGMALNRSRFQPINSWDLKIIPLQVWNLLWSKPLFRALQIAVVILCHFYDNHTHWHFWYYDTGVKNPCFQCWSQFLLRILWGWKDKKTFGHP